MARARNSVPNGYARMHRPLWYIHMLNALMEVGSASHDLRDYVIGRGVWISAPVLPRPACVPIRAGKCANLCPSVGRACTSAGLCARIAEVDGPQKGASHRGKNTAHWADARRQTPLVVVFAAGGLCLAIVEFRWDRKTPRSRPCGPVHGIPLAHDEIILMEPLAGLARPTRGPATCSLHSTNAFPAFRFVEHAVFVN
ncbi:hypothetical protein KM043_015361 [Ampulex compressa]|nr:hypothetical protein KM043_015361 [Ampulex compressa]